MASFTDKAGRVWKLSMPESAVHVLFALGVRAFENPRMRFELLWNIAQAQAERFDIDKSAFDQLVSDEATFAEANKALHLAIESFALKLLSVDFSDLTGQSLAYRRFHERCSDNASYCHTERLGEGFSAIVVFATSSRLADTAEREIDRLMSQGLTLVGFGHYQCVMALIVRTETITARMRRRLVRLSRKLGASFE